MIVVEMYSKELKIFHIAGPFEDNKEATKFRDWIRSVTDERFTSTVRVLPPELAKVALLVDLGIITEREANAEFTRLEEVS